MFGMFSKTKGKRVALIDVSSSSVRAAYALLSQNAPVRIVYENRVPIEVRGEGIVGTSMLRALDAALRDLKSKGGPELRKATGDGGAELAFTCVCAPWQKASVRTEKYVDEKEFLITESLIKDALSKAPDAPHETRTEEAVVATLLNGYEVHAPVGKRATNASIIILTASMEQESFGVMRRALAGVAHEGTSGYASFSSTCYRALVRAFPHEKDYIAVRVSGDATELAFTSRGFPIRTAAVAVGINAFERAAKASGLSGFSASTDTKSGVIDREGNVKLAEALQGAETSWTRAVSEVLKDFAGTNALPRTIFLVADEETTGFLARLIDSPDIHALWLSDEALSIIPLTSLHFGESVKRDKPFPRNVPVDLLALSADSLIGG